MTAITDIILLLRDQTTILYTTARTMYIETTLSNSLKTIHKTRDYKYVFVCGKDSFINVENLITYIDQEERTGRLSPTTDAVIVGPEDPYTYILTQKSIVYLLDEIHESYILPHLQKVGTGIITEHNRFYKGNYMDNPKINLKTMISCNNSKYEDIIVFLEKEKDKIIAQKQHFQNILYRRI
jgi:hypothetical protein